MNQTLFLFLGDLFDSATLGPLLISYGTRLVGALLLLAFGWGIVGGITRSIVTLMRKRRVDESLQTFLGSLLGILLKTILVITALSVLGVEMTSLVAILGAAGLAVGLALSGTLQNFAGGVMILLFRPFKVGDFIEAQGFKGTVSEIQIFNTILKTLGNVTIIIPNGALSTGPMTNFTTEPTRRVDWVFGVAYGDDADKVEEVLHKLMQADERILKDPAPEVLLSSLSDSSVDFTTRAWVKPEDYWPVFFDMNKKVYKAFAQEGLSIPFPQMDVHIHKNEG